MLPAPVEGGRGPEAADHGGGVRATERDQGRDEARVRGPQVWELRQGLLRSIAHHYGHRGGRGDAQGRLRRRSVDRADRRGAVREGGEDAQQVRQVHGLR